MILLISNPTDESSPSFYIFPGDRDECAEIVKSLKNTRCDPNAIPVRLFESIIVSIKKTDNSNHKPHIHKGHFPKSTQNGTRYSNLKKYTNNPTNVKTYLRTQLP